MNILIAGIDGHLGWALAGMFEDLMPNRERIAKYREVPVPDFHWDGSKGRVGLAR